MDNEKIEKLLKCIDADLRALADAAEVNHIIAFIINGRVHIDDYSDIDNPKFNYFKTAEDLDNE